MSTTFASPALAGCPVCHGTGHDEAFNSPCNCPAMIGRSARTSALAQDDGMSGRPLPTGGAQGPSSSSSPAPARTNLYPGSCVLCGTRVAAGAGRLVREGQGWAIKCQEGTCRTVAGVTAPPAPAQPAAQRRNRYAGTCTTCGGHVAPDAGLLERDAAGAWITRHDGPCPLKTDLVETQVVHSTGLDLSGLPTVDTQDAMYFGVPGGHTRLKVRVRRPDDGKWAGWIFVDDGAVYGEGQRYGRQAPGQKYSGDIEAALAAILADPMGALRRYAELTNRCGVCNRPLENAESVARGIGPVCARELTF